MSRLSDKSVNDLREHIAQLLRAGKDPADDEIVKKSCQWLGKAEDGVVHVARCGVEPNELPSKQLVGLWQSLHYEEGFLEGLWEQMQVSVGLEGMGVDRSMVGWGRIWLFHGPPGTGKSSVAKALAQRMAMRWSVYGNTQKPVKLVHLECSKLLSKWLGESSRLIGEAFTMTGNYTTWMIIDEVESLAMNRSRAGADAEPGDAIRAVNTLLCHLDQLPPNIWIIMTTNLISLLDPALRDRVDWEIPFIAPSAQAIRQILWQAIQELTQKRVITDDGLTKLDHAAQALYGHSGRTIRKCIFRALCQKPKTTEQLLSCLITQQEPSLIN